MRALEEAPLRLSLTPLGLMGKIFSQHATGRLNGAGPMGKLLHRKKREGHNLPLTRSAALGS